MDFARNLIAASLFITVLLPAWAYSAHSAIGRGPTEPEAKHNAEMAARQTYGDAITSWGRQDCTQQQEGADDRAPQQPSPYTVPRTPQKTVFVCQVEFNTRD